MASLGLGRLNQAGQEELNRASLPQDDAGHFPQHAVFERGCNCRSPKGESGAQKDHHTRQQSPRLHTGAMDEGPGQPHGIKEGLRRPRLSPLFRAAPNNAGEGKGNFPSKGESGSTQQEPSGTFK